jgi:hypothetical protein
VADLRAKGMTVAESVDKARFQAQLAPVYADFAKRFGQENIDRSGTTLSDRRSYQCRGLSIGLTIPARSAWWASPSDANT